MKTEVGLWIDHHKAVIALIENENIVTQKNVVNMDEHVRYSNGDHSITTNVLRGTTAQVVRDRLPGKHMDRYYDEIISIICDAESIWIFGPGEAKIELENRLRHAELGARVVGIESVGEMTDSQLIAKVWDRFLEK